MSRVLAFHTSAAACKPVAGKAKSPDWAMLLERGRHLTVEHALPEFHEWHDIIRRVQRNLPWLKARWEQRTIDTWCHGDVHPGNVLRRVMPGGSLAHAGSGPCVLIDLALVHVGHWMEDALYLERQYWGHEDWIGHAKPLTILARLRREAGLPTESAYAELANVRRVLMASCAPAMIGTEGGNQKYLHSALEHAKMLLPMVLH
jgi:aminoglycoside phosphotransferase (APT) family kinase protein